MSNRRQVIVGKCCLASVRRAGRIGLGLIAGFGCGLRIAQFLAELNSTVNDL